MTQLRENAIEAVRKLLAPAQDAIAVFILDQIADDHAWDESFARSQDQLAQLAAKARAAVAAGRFRPLRHRLS